MTELRALANDIKANGQLEAIVLYDGKVLDGRNRLAACELAGVEPRTEPIVLKWVRANRVAVLSGRYLHRRQLAESQGGGSSCRCASVA
jgi:ParB-like chromosome segregation protein Spo0J